MIIAKSVEGYTIQVNNASGKLKILASELESTNNKIDRQSSNWTKLGKYMDTVGSKLKSVGEGFSNAGKKLSLASSNFQFHQ